MLSRSVCKCHGWLKQRSVMEKKDMHLAVYNKNAKLNASKYIVCVRKKNVNHKDKLLLLKMKSLRDNLNALCHLL